MSKALFVDLDGTVRKSMHENGTPLSYPRNRDHIASIRGTGKLWGYRKKGYKVIAVTNQGGVGSGVISFAECWDAIRHTQERLDFFFDKVYMAAARNKTHPRRKPQPTMALEAAEKFQLDLKQSIMVGDMESDKEFAVNAGIGKFHWADDFFGDYWE
jgi:D-glycero-D-manno-heptose 1,7-bisphosphate phosphatase